MARSKFASIWPPGAIRLVPTLMTTLIRKLSWQGEMVSHLTPEDDFPSCDNAIDRSHPSGGTGSPVGRDNIHILQLKWLSGKMKKLATFRPMPTSDATSRFSNRVENYVRYRPGYPPEVVRALKAECGLMPGHTVADIASGTGIWTRMLLENGNAVFGIEPNAEMRKAGERLLAAYPKFASVASTAEVTTLAGQSVDFVTAAQAA